MEEEKVEIAVPEMKSLLMRTLKRPRKKLKKKRRSLNLNTRRLSLVKTLMISWVPSRPLEVRKMLERLRKLMLLSSSRLVLKNSKPLNSKTNT